MAECASLSKKNDAVTGEDLYGEDTSSMEGETFINRLPDTVLLEIFSKLTFADLCRCAGVCRMWYRLTKDYSLRRVIRIDGGAHDGDTHDVLSLVRQHFSDQLRVFEVNYYRDLPYNQYPNELNTIDNEIMSNIVQSATSIRKLVFNYCYFQRNVHMGHFPSSITHLSLRNSDYTFNNFIPSNVYLPKLSCLDLSCDDEYGYTVSASKKRGLYRSLNLLTSLKALFLVDCPISSTDIRKLSPILPNLEVLDIEGSNVSDEGVSIIFQKCVRMKCLYMGVLTFAMLNSWASSFKEDTMKELEYLCVEDVGPFLRNMMKWDLREKRPTKLVIQYSEALDHNLQLPFVLEDANVTLKWKERHDSISHYEYHKEFDV